MCGGETNKCCCFVGDIRSRLKGRRSIVCNNIGNHKDNRSDVEYIKNKYDHDNIR